MTVLVPRFLPGAPEETQEYLGHDIRCPEHFQNVPATRIRKVYITTYAMSLNCQLNNITLINGACGRVLVEALSYKPEGRGFASR
jgi:hypothetical protein